MCVCEFTIRKASLGMRVVLLKLIPVELLVFVTAGKEEEK